MENCYSLKLDSIAEGKDRWETEATDIHFAALHSSFVASHLICRTVGEAFIEHLSKQVAKLEVEMRVASDIYHPLSPREDERNSLKTNLGPGKIDSLIQSW